MNEKEKKELAKKVLRRNGYTEKEIKRILKRAFGDKETDNAN